MSLEETTQGSATEAKRKPPVRRKKAKVVPVPVVMKTVHNVSLQSWAIPTGTGLIELTPGGSVAIPASAITSRLINLQKRRLISIS
jgi:hypothetical protein